MMNSMTNLEFVNNLVENTTHIIKSETIDNQQLAFEIETSDVFKVLVTLKSAGWKQLSYLSAIDWPKENKMELIYLLFNWDKPVYIQIRTKLNREDPIMNSILPIFPGAKYYERETHEMFGIKFPGNPDYEKKLILEIWNDIPPLRKDFIPADFSKKKYLDREYPQNFSVIDPDNHLAEERDARKERAESLRTGGKKQ